MSLPKNFFDFKKTLKNSVRSAFLNHMCMTTENSEKIEKAIDKFDQDIDKILYGENKNG